MASLSLVPFQLSLPGFEFFLQSFPDQEKEERTRSEWLKSVRDYCLWRAGDGWRRLGRAGQRQSPERWEYLEAARLIISLLAASAVSRADQAAQLELDVARGAAIPLSASEFKLTIENRNALVAELLRDPLYTDARLLRSLTKNKLARMVMQSRQRRVADAQTERRSA